MKKLIEQIKREYSVNEDWKKTALALGTSAALTLGGTNASATNVHHHGRHHSSRQDVSSDKVINAIVGEASNQGYQGMLAIACAIRNRMKDSYYRNRPLQGVYGKNASHNSSESPRIWEEAKKAWADSASKDITGGAIIWGNDSDIQTFRTQEWFNNVEQTVKIGAHTFFRKR